MRHAIGRDDDLFLRVIEGVERVEEFFLTVALARDELNIVD